MNQEEKIKLIYNLRLISSVFYISAFIVCIASLIIDFELVKLIKNGFVVLSLLIVARVFDNVIYNLESRK